MEKEQQIIKSKKLNDNLHKVAKVALVILLLNIVGQLATVYQTRYQLVSPLIPERTIWEINKQFIFLAIVSAITSVIGLVLYFFDKYLLVLILVALVLTAQLFLYV